jgi:hypothetical protein
VEKMDLFLKGKENGIISPWPRKMDFLLFSSILILISVESFLAGTENGGEMEKETARTR